MQSGQAPSSPRAIATSSFVLPPEDPEHRRVRLFHLNLQHERDKALSVHVDAYQPPKGFYKTDPSKWEYPKGGYPEPPPGSLLIWAREEPRVDHDSDVPSLDQEWKGGERYWLMQAPWVAVALDKSIPGETAFVLGVVSSWRMADSEPFATHALKTWWYTPDAFSKAGIMQYVKTGDHASRSAMQHNPPAHFTSAELADLTGETTLVKIRERLHDHAGREDDCEGCARDTSVPTVWCTYTTIRM